MKLLGRITFALALAGPLAAALPVAAQGRPTGDEIYRLTEQYIAAAPHRFIGSPGHAAAEQFIKAHFAPEMAKHDFLTDGFVARTPIGMLPMTNYIVKYPGKKNGIIVIASHYETNYWLKDINYIGANDGGCTTALLIALGRYYRDHPPQGYSVWLLFDDGEESILNDGMPPNDSLYGVRHIAAKWSGDGTIGHIKAFLLADMIGARDLNIDKETNSTPWLVDLLAQAGKDLGDSSYLFRNSLAIDDDHLPFLERGVPSLDVIDYEYGPFDSSRNPPDYAYHHTAKDTMDKLSARSLQVSSDLFIELVKLIDQR